MKKIKDLSLEECQQVINEILQAVYGDKDFDDVTGDVRETLNPEATWTPETIQAVADALIRHDLQPDEEILLDEQDAIADIVVHCPCGDLDCTVCGGNADWKPGDPNAR